MLKAIRQLRLIVTLCLANELAGKASVVLGIQRRRERNFISFLNRLRLNPLRADPGPHLLNELR